MYTRSPSRKGNFDPPIIKKETPSAIQLPQNYSGNAFTSDGYKRPISPESPTPSQSAEQDTHRRAHISPSISPTIPVSSRGSLGYSDYPEAPDPHEDIPPKADFEERDQDTVEVSREISRTEPIGLPERSGAGSLFSSMLPGGVFKNNFPFGHGLGSEELLILGLMLSIYMSGEADGELMMLLGILLLAG